MRAILIITFIILINFNNLDSQHSKSQKNLSSKNYKNKLINDTTKINIRSSDTCFKSSRNKCSMQKNNKQCRMKDTFIDKDGDGMNDLRCKGMGLGCNKRNRNCFRNK